MSKPRRIACLSLLTRNAIYDIGCNLPQGPISWDVIPVEQDLDLIRQEIRRALEDYDAVALEGIATSFYLGDETYRHDFIWRSLDLNKYGDRFSDGSALQASLERYLVRQAADRLKDEISGKQVLFFCGLNRYGSAEVLSNFTNRMLFGDMLYGFRLGIPIYSLQKFITTAKRLARAVAKTPANWFWPSARRKPPIMPRFQRYFRQSTVIVGGISYFQRYMPDTLAGKIIFTNIHNDAELEMFAERKAKYVVSLTPVIDGTYVPQPVLEAALKLYAGDGDTTNKTDFFLDQLHAMALTPHIVDLEREGSEDLALVELPPRAPELAQPPKNIELSPSDEVAKFCFVIHPLSFKYIERIPAVRAMQHFVPRRMIEDAVAHIKPWPVGTLRNVVSATGAKAEGVLYAIPMTSKAIMRFPEEFLYKRLLQVAEDAAEHGCKLMGLGAYTSVAGDAGLTVSKSSPIGVTSGNSYTVAATLLTLEQAAGRCGIEIDKARLLIIGATGSIGSICARLTAPRVAELYMVSPRPEKLLSLSRFIETENPKLKGKIKLSRQVSDFLPLADGIITTTSSVDPVIDVAELKPGCLVLDVARPPDIKQQAAERRNDILVIESGEVLLPEGAELNYDIGLPPGVIYACLAETLLLALEKRFGNFTLGREIKPEQVNLIAEIGHRHGFKLAPIRSFGQVIEEARFTRLAEINSERFGNRRPVVAEP
ncbi:hypothetical protein JW859_12530 [bacterium]|nr:hypothetical protein [bacterium]